MKNLLGIFFDLINIIKGRFLKNTRKEYKYAFLVHSRNYSDIHRKYRVLFKFIPKPVALFLMKHLWPITLSEITGLHDYKTGNNVKGYVLGITMTADQMLKQRSYALTKIRQALYLARGKGVHIIGLGGLTSSLSRGGLDLVDIDINMTTGHAYTAYNIYRNIKKLTEIISVDQEKIKIAIVGAAGSVGSTVTQLLVRDNYKSLVVIDISRKNEKLNELKNTTATLNSKTKIVSSNDIRDIEGCDFIVTATNTAEALITEELVKDGMIFVDDAQPSDIHPDVLRMPNILVLEAGVVHTPGIKSNFNYGLKKEDDNFCCMAELLILASYGWDKHYVINRASLENIDHISDLGQKLGFEIGSFQNFLESVSREKIEHIKSIIIKKHAL